MSMFSDLDLDFTTVHGKLPFEKEGIYEAKLSSVKYFNNEEKNTYGIIWVFEHTDAEGAELAYTFTQNLTGKEGSKLSFAMELIAHIVLSIKNDVTSFKEVLKKAKELKDLVEGLNQFLKDDLGKTSFFMKISRSVYNNEYKYGFNQVNRPFIAKEANLLRLTVKDLEVLDTNADPTSGAGVYEKPKSAPGGDNSNDLEIPF